MNKILDAYRFATYLDLSLKNDVNLSSKGNEQEIFFQN
jgi:hypothetical protein